MTTKDEEKVYINGKESKELIFPKETIFDHEFLYGISALKTLYSLSQGIYNSKVLDPSHV